MNRVQCQGLDMQLEKIDLFLIIGMPVRLHTVLSQCLKELSVPFICWEGSWTKLKR